mmetsp:Transcript_36917/g.61178  ORF Transcript_36917/g.61178 Transcript_36917/m.61178 type:complete len:419 (-) Transcript_36917:295-1551(-)|eukprot:CAMPEP_0119319636 /NCGR_PEP_ID=MMETSP1333-20130426/49936_1 /TAXON_ID=418940 /ORGANISM="Scyphosphaera apsteinii, Strain RCC1455" /LENGTH=418 /DNA_ID=CAMNT_0007326099 /DNA_START=165 /DNA_END=1421 /DNA_ORIENTATION=+
MAPILALVMLYSGLRPARVRMRGYPSPVLAARGDSLSPRMSTAYIHLHGLPWEASTEIAARAVRTMLPEGCSLVETVLVIDKRARNTGRAILRVELVNQSSVQAILEAIQGKTVGKRWLEARQSTAAEYTFHLCKRASIQSRVSSYAQYCCPDPHNGRQGLPDDPRDVVVLCHATPMELAAGQIDLNNLPHGRVDLLARCASASLFLSHGIRKNVRLWLMLRASGITLCCCGNEAKGLHPSERNIASAIRRTLRASHPASSSGGANSARGAAPAATPTGWRAFHGDALKQRLASLSSKGMRLVALDERATTTLPQLLKAQPEAGPEESEQVQHDAWHATRSEATSLTKVWDRCTGTVLVVGDHEGFTVEEEEVLHALGAARVKVGPVVLLASHSIVIAHATLDEAWCAAQPSPDALTL